MKTLKSGLIILLVLSFNINSQEYEDSFINPTWDFYSFNYLNTPSAGRGFTGIAAQNDISGNLLNPASINLESKYQVNLQYTYKTSNNWLPIFFPDTYIEHQVFSGSAAFGYRINKYFQTGLIYSNPASMRYSIDEISFINGSSGEFYDNVVFHSISVPLVYQEKNYSLGLSISYILTKTTSAGDPSIQPDGTTAASWMIRGQAGFIYNFAGGLSIGAKSADGRQKENVI